MTIVGQVLSLRDSNGNLGLSAFGLGHWRPQDRRWPLGILAPVSREVEKVHLLPLVMPPIWEEKRQPVFAPGSQNLNEN